MSLYLDDLRSRLDDDEAFVGVIQELWVKIAETDWCPNDAFILGLMASFSDPRVIEYGVRITAAKENNGTLRGPQGWAKYIYGVCRNAERYGILDGGPRA